MLFESTGIFVDYENSPSNIYFYFRGKTTSASKELAD